jgi:hypothetical protein
LDLKGVKDLPDPRVTTAMKVDRERVAREVHLVTRESRACLATRALVGLQARLATVVSLETLAFRVLPG